jgi:CRISPR-associated protein Cas1
MSTLYLDRRDLRLEREDRAIAVYHGADRQGTLPMGMLERVVIRGNVHLDTGLLGALAEQGASILLQSGRYGRIQALLLGGSHGDAARRVAQYRLYTDAAWRLSWSRWLVIRKLLGQVRLLRRALRERPDCRKPLSDGLATLEPLLGRVRLPPEGGLERLRGQEGAAAAAYFGAFTSLFPASLGFTGRNRRPPRDPVNACLSLAYTLMHFEAARACHAAGLDPLIGFYHELAYSRESLAADFLEPLRPRVDAFVWELFRAQVLRESHFQTGADGCLLGKAGRRIFYAEHEIFACPLRRLLRRAAERVVRLVVATGVDPT